MSGASDINEKEQIDKEQQRRLASDRSVRLRLARCQWGIERGWWVEWRGQKVATLTDPQWAEMFWVSYAITPLEDDPAVKSALATADFWWSEEVLFRNREFDFIAPFAFGSGNGPSEGRIAMRGLYIRPPLTFCDHVVLFFDRIFRRHQAAPLSWDQRALEHFPKQ